jgi:hypothetical protein
LSKGKAAGKKTASKSVGATGGTGRRKGPQPALYRDPKSGATWSGRGRAPAWLAGAKDRSKFVIEGVAASAAVVKTSVPKAAAQKTATKKTVVKDAPAAKKAVAGKKLSVNDSSALSKQVAAKKVGAAPVKRPAAKKVAASKSDVVDAVATALYADSGSDPAPISMPTPEK